MPLINGYSERSLKENIRRLIKEGKPQKQAVAIAKDIQRRVKKKRKKS